MCSCTQIIAKMGFYRCIIRTYVVVFTREIGGRLQLGFDYVIMHVATAELRRFMAAVALRMDQAVSVFVSTYYRLNLCGRCGGVCHQSYCLFTRYVTPVLARHLIAG